MSLRIAAGAVALKVVAAAAAEGESAIPGIGAECFGIMQQGIEQSKLPEIWERCSKESTAPCEFDAELDIATRATYDRYVQCLEKTAGAGEGGSPVAGIAQECYSIVHGSIPEKEAGDIRETCQVKVPAVCQFTAWTDVATPETFEKFTKCQEGLGSSQAGGQGSPIQGVSNECFAIMRKSVDEAKAEEIRKSCPAQGVDQAKCEFKAWLKGADDETRQSYEECLEGRAGKNDDKEIRVAGVSEECFGIIRSGVDKSKAEEIHSKCEAKTPARCEFDAWFDAASSATKAAMAKCYEELNASENEETSGGAAVASPIDGVAQKCFEQLQQSVEKEKAVDIRETCKQEVPAMCEFDALRSAADADTRQKYENCLGAEASQQKAQTGVQMKFVTNSARLPLTAASASRTPWLLRAFGAAGMVACLALAQRIARSLVGGEAGDQDSAPLIEAEA